MFKFYFEEKPHSPACVNFHLFSESFLKTISSQLISMVECGCYFKNLLRDTFPAIALIVIHDFQRWQHFERDLSTGHHIVVGTMLETGREHYIYKVMIVLASQKN